MSLKLNVRHASDVVIVDAVGRITLGEGANIFRDAIQDVGKSNPKKVLLNLAEVSYVDSCGTGEMVAAYSLFVNQGGRMKLINVGKRVHDLLKITGLTSLFEMYENEGAAIQSFQ